MSDVIYRRVDILHTRLSEHNNCARTTVERRKLMIKESINFNLKLPMGAKGAVGKVVDILHVRRGDRPICNFGFLLLLKDIVLDNRVLISTGVLMPLDYIHKLLLCYL